MVGHHGGSEGRRMRHQWWWIRCAVAALFVLWAVVPGKVQERQGTFRIAADTAAEVGEWDALVDQFVGDRTLVLRTHNEDSELVGRAHESLVQYYRGLPVWGADITRQMDRG